MSAATTAACSPRTRCATPSTRSRGSAARGARDVRARARRAASWPPGRRSARRAVEIEEHPWERLGADGARTSTRSSAAAAARAWPTVTPATAAIQRDQAGHRGPAGAQDDRLGVGGLRARPVHDAARDRRPHPRAPSSRAWDYTGDDLGYGRRLGRRARHDARRRSATTTARRCSSRSTAWARRCSSATRRSRRIRLSLPNRHHLLYDLTRSGSTTTTRSSTRRPSRTG